MHRMKRIVATILLLLVMGLGTTPVFAEDKAKPTETPGFATPADVTGTMDATGAPDIFNEILVNLLSTLIP